MRLLVRSEIPAATARATSRCRPCRSRRRQQRLVAWRWARGQFTSIQAGMDMALVGVETARETHTARLAPAASAARRRQSSDARVGARSRARSTQAAARELY